jgi:hypothetical protein
MADARERLSRVSIPFAAFDLVTVLASIDSLIQGLSLNSLRGLWSRDVVANPSDVDAVLE